MFTGQPGKGLHKHISANDARKLIGPEQREKCYKFSFVRHPYSRAVSLYTFSKKMLETYLDRGIVGRLKMNRRTKLLNWPAIKVVQETEDFQSFLRHPLSRNTSVLIPQTNWLYDGNDVSLIDFIGKVESIKSDFGEVCQNLSIPRLSMSHANQSGADGRFWKAFYKNESDYEIVRSAVSKDFELLGYSSEY